MAEKEVYRGTLPEERDLAGVPVLGGLQALASYFVPIERDVITPPETTYTEDMGVRYATTTPGEYGEPRFGTPAAIQGGIDFFRQLIDSPVETGEAIASGIASIPREQYLAGMGLREGYDAVYDPATGEEFRYDPFLITGPQAVGSNIAIKQAINAGESGTFLGAGPTDIDRRLRVGKSGIRGLAHGIRKNDLFEIDPVAAERYFSATDGVNPEEMLLYRGGFDLGGQKLTVKDIILNSGFSNRARQVLLGQKGATSAEVKRPGFSTSRDAFLSYSGFTKGGGTTTPVTDADLDDILVVSPRRTVREGEDGSFTVDELVLGDIEDLSPAAYYLKAYDPSKQIQLKPNSEYFEDEIHLGGASGAGSDVRPLTDREKQDLIRFINSQQESYDILKAARQNRMPAPPPFVPAAGEVLDVAPFVAGFTDHVTLLGMLNGRMQSPVLRRNVEDELAVAATSARNILMDMEPGGKLKAFELQHGPEGVAYLRQLAKIDFRRSDMNTSPFNPDREVAMLADLKAAYDKLGDNAINSTIVAPMGDTLKGANVSLGGDRGTFRMEPSNDLQVLMQSVFSTQDKLRQVRAGGTYDVGGMEISERALVERLDKVEAQLESEFPAWKLFYQMRPDPELGRNALIVGPEVNAPFNMDVERMANTLIRAGKTELGADSYPQVGAYRRQVAEQIAALWPNTRQAIEVNVNEMPEAQAYNALIRQKRALVDGALADAAALFPANVNARIAASKDLSSALENLEKSKKGFIGRGGQDPEVFVDAARQDVKDATVGPRPGAVLYEDGGVVSMVDVARNTTRGPRGLDSLVPVARKMSRSMIA